MAISKASGHWDGGLKDGKGTMKPAHGADVGFTAGTRFEGAPGSNPEEMIGAALAGCFSMALSAGLEKANAKPKSIHTTADVRLEKKDEGFTIVRIDLSCEAKVEGIDDAKFQEVAAATKKGCPISRALSGGIDVHLTAKLAQ